MDQVRKGEIVRTRVTLEKSGKLRGSVEKPEEKRQLGRPRRR
jgi:hypothetical protein